MYICHGAHNGEEHETRSKLKITIFNKSERARQGKAETDRNTGVITSRPDRTKLNRQQLKYPGNH